MDHAEILTEAIKILRDRDQQYGNIHDVTARACEIFELITGMTMTSYQANMFLHCVKLARIKGSPGKPDHYIDGVNYLAFAGEFAPQKSASEGVTLAEQNIINHLTSELNNQETN